MLLSGIHPPITTPFYPDGNIYFKKLEANVERYSRTPVAGLVVLGSTGEAILLSDEERRAVLKTARESTANHKVLDRRDWSRIRARHAVADRIRRQLGLRRRHGSYPALLQKPDEAGQYAGVLSHGGGPLAHFRSSFTTSRKPPDMTSQPKSSSNLRTIPT